MHPTGRLAPRADIVGMQAVAVLLIVVAHASAGRFAGGVIGIDMLLVIAGFRIMSQLTDEQSATGTISPGRFYSRGALRAMPAATVVLLFTLVGSWLWLAPNRFADSVRDVVLAGFHIINLRPSDPSSPVGQFWALAAIAQFYLLLPLLMLLIRRRGQVAIVLGVLAAATLAVSLFGTPMPLWQLGVGALVALGPRIPLWTAGVGGVAVIAAVVVHDGSAYLALLPVAGTALLLATRLSLTPLRFLDRLSYGWYLWHWPLLVFAPAVGFTGNLGLAGAALALAYVSHSLVENPVRQFGALRRRSARGIGLGLSLSSTMAAAAISMAILLPPGIPPGDGPQLVPAEAATGLPSAEPLVAKPTPTKALPSMAGLVAEGLKRQTAPRNLEPELAKAAKDQPVLYENGCHLGPVRVSLPDDCVFGDLSAPTTVVLFGDSHAAQWFPALEQLAKTKRWRLVTMTKSSCGVADVAVYDKTLQRVYTECQQWRRSALDRIAELRPALVVVSALFDGRAPIPAGSNPEATWVSGWKRSLVSLKAAAAHVVMLVDTPYRSSDGPACVAAHQNRLTACIQSTAGALWEPRRRASVAKLAKSLGVVVIDPIPWMCLNGKCPIVIGNVLVYRDNHHISRTFARLVTPMIEAQLPAFAP